MKLNEFSQSIQRAFMFDPPEITSPVNVLVTVGDKTYHVDKVSKSVDTNNDICLEVITGEEA